MTLLVATGMGIAVAIPAIRELDRTTEVGTNEAVSPATIFAIVGVFALVTLVVAVMSVLVSLATVQVVVRTATGGRPRVGECLAAALPRFFPVLGWFLLAGLITIAGMLACVLPGYYFTAVFTVLVPVIAFERGNAISRCFRLFHGNIGASLARVLGIVAVGVGVSMVGQVAMLIVVAVGGLSGGSIGTIIGAVSAGVLIVLLTIAAKIVTEPLTVTAYAEMRARIEPVSTAILAAELGQTAYTAQRFS